MMAAGVAITVASGLAAAWLVTSAGHRVAVLAAAHNIPIGSVITQADLQTVDISTSPGVATIPASQAGQVAGREAAVDLRAGTLLAASDLTTTVVPGPGQVLVPVALKSWQMPASGLAPGDTVLVIPAPTAGAQPGGASGPAPQTGNVPATVYRVSAPDQAGNVTTDLLLPAKDGPVVAREAAAAQVALIETYRGAG
jgi:hypothetical protein